MQWEVTEDCEQENAISRRELKYYFAVSKEIGREQECRRVTNEIIVKECKKVYFGERLLDVDGEKRQG